MSHLFFRLNAVRTRSRAGLLVALFATQAAFAALPVFNVADFGAVPNDGKCDVEAIARAIAAAKRAQGGEIRFAAGTYNLRQPTSREYYLGLVESEHVALVGAVDAAGRPATRLERNFKLTNDTSLPPQLMVLRSQDITVKNLILANDPPLGSTGRVIAVDPAKDVVTVEVLPGLPSYDGMRAASAHAWNLETGKLKRFGRTPNEATLTIGTNVNKYWQAVPDSAARQLVMRQAGFAAKLAVGDGVSWHHTAQGSRNQTGVMYSRDVVFENVVMPNVSNMGMLAGFNHNLTFRRLRFEPEHGNLAIGGRDGLHLSMNSGGLLVEDCTFQGLRMDPLVIRRSFGIVKEVRPDGSLLISPGYEVPAGDKLRFWVDGGPHDRVVKAARRQKGGYVYTFAEAAPAHTVVGTAVSFLTYSLERGTIRGCHFLNNFGSAIVDFEENLTIEDCVFDHNSYQIKFGPNQSSGGFVRHTVVRNNRFLNTSWIDIANRGAPANIVIHSLSKFFPRSTVRFNGDILIEKNSFANPDGQTDAVAIDVRNAENVRIVDNHYEGFAHPVKFDPATTSRMALPLVILPKESGS